MPGAYAHITLVNIASEIPRLEEVIGFPPQATEALNRYIKFCELGAVSPDYPYLSITDTNAKKWADNMHYTKTGDFIKCGISILKTYPEGDIKKKCLAWLLGYCAHVATDVTIHPIIEIKVGAYEYNKTAHRECEMHQDTYIWQRRNLGEQGLSEYFDSGIADCSQIDNRELLDMDIQVFWDSMFKSNYNSEYRMGPPNIHGWHRKFVNLIDTIEESGWLFSFARHVSVNCGLTYPLPSEVEEHFINALPVPNRTNSMSYDKIFDYAIENVTKVWKWVATAVLENDTEYKTAIGNWDLDTGKDMGSNRYVFW